MPKAKQKLQSIHAATTVISDQPSLKLNLVIPFSELGKETEGSSYFVPVKARDEGGEILKGDGQLPVPSEDGKADLYVKKDGSFTYEPFEKDGRTVKADCKAEGRKATPHFDFSKKIIDSTLVWPDGNMRDIKVTIKANNPRNPADYKATQQEAAQKRGLAKAENMSVEDLNAEIARLQTLMASKQVNQPAA